MVPLIVPLNNKTSKKTKILGITSQGLFPLKSITYPKTNLSVLYFFFKNLPLHIHVIYASARSLQTGVLFGL